MSLRIDNGCFRRAAQVLPDSWITPSEPPRSNYPFRVDVAMSALENGAVPPIIEWCRVSFGVTDARWNVNFRLARFYFTNRADAVLFLLRWNLEAAE